MFALNEVLALSLTRSKQVGTEAERMIENGAAGILALTLRFQERAIHIQPAGSPETGCYGIADLQH